MQIPDTQNLRAVADVFFDGRMPTRENFLAQDEAPELDSIFGW